MADAAEDDSPYRADEPYRRAVRGLHARVHATALARGITPNSPPAHRSLPPYTSSRELPADLDIVITSLRSHGAADIAEARVEPVRRSVELFGFHLCSLDLRQNSEIHGAVLDELFREVMVCDHYLELDEPARVALLTAELHSPRPLRAPYVAYSELTLSELEILENAAIAFERFGASVIRQYVISKCESVSDMLEVAVLLREVGLFRPGTHDGLPSCACGIVPMFETIPDLQGASATIRAVFEIDVYAEIAGCSTVAAARSAEAAARAMKRPHTG